MIDYMLMNLGLVADALGIEPEDVVHNISISDDIMSEKNINSYTSTESLLGQIHNPEAILISENFYSPIRRIDFL